jgi:hypothetical protein
MAWSTFFADSAGRRERRAREAELEAFRAALVAACAAPLNETATAEADALRLVARASALGLTEEEAALELEMLDGLRDAIAFAKTVARDGLPLLDTQHRILAGEPCRFSAPVTRVDTTEGVAGRLFLTDARAVFLGVVVTALPWASVARIVRDARDVVFAGAQRRHHFRFNTFADALRATWLADRLAGRAR